MVAMGSLLTEAFNQDFENNIKIKKKNKKKDKFDLVNPSQLQPSLRNNIDGFDRQFESSSNSIQSNNFEDFYHLEEQENYFGGYYPYNPNIVRPPKKQPHGLKAPRSPHLEAQPSHVNNPNQQPQHQPQHQQPQHQQPQHQQPQHQQLSNVNNPNQQHQQPQHQQPNMNKNAILIPQKEYNDFVLYKNEINKKQRELSQIEGFSNVNDELNDVLLFALFGIFFLIFTDYIYKMGKKSY